DVIVARRVVARSVVMVRAARSLRAEVLFGEPHGALRSKARGPVDPENAMDLACYAAALAEPLPVVGGARPGHDRRDGRGRRARLSRSRSVAVFTLAYASACREREST